jgi:hypothetical protein
MFRIFSGIFLLIFFLVLLTSCHKILLSCYGLKETINNDTAHIEKYIKKFNLESDKVFVLNSRSYSKMIDSLHGYAIGSPNRTLSKDFAQPMMLKLFVKDTLHSYLVNCYTGGFPNFNWNIEGSFDNYPLTLPQKTEAKIPLSDELNYLNSINGFSPKVENPEVFSDSCLIVYWTCITNRQSKRLINLVKEYKSLNNIRSLEIVFVNTEQFMFDYEEKRLCGPDDVQ